MAWEYNSNISRILLRWFRTLFDCVPDYIFFISAVPSAVAIWAHDYNFSPGSKHLAILFQRSTQLQIPDLLSAIRLSISRIKLTFWDFYALTDVKTERIPTPFWLLLLWWHLFFSWILMLSGIITLRIQFHKSKDWNVCK